MESKVLEFAKEKLLSEGVFLALVSVIATALTYAYEVGYLAFYGVPDDVIELGISRIMSSTFAMGLFLALVWAWVSRLISAFTSEYRPVRRGVEWFFYLLALAVLIWLALRVHWIIVVGSLIFPVFLAVVWALQVCFERLGRGNRVIAEAVEAGKIAAGRADRLAVPIVLPFMLLLLFFVVAASFGFNFAKLGSTYWVLSDHPNFVMVRKYNEIYIFKQFDQETGSLSGEVRLLKVGDADPLKMTSKNLELKSARKIVPDKKFFLE